MDKKQVTKKGWRAMLINSKERHYVAENATIRGNKAEALKLGIREE